MNYHYLLVIGLGIRSLSVYKLKIMLENVTNWDLNGYYPILVVCCVVVGVCGAIVYESVDVHAGAYLCRLHGWGQSCVGFYCMLIAIVLIGAPLTHYVYKHSVLDMLLG